MAKPRVCRVGKRNDDAVCLRGALLHAAGKKARPQAALSPDAQRRFSGFTFVDPGATIRCSDIPPQQAQNAAPAGDPEEEDSWLTILAMESCGSWRAWE
jgi:hypothetical protein